MCSSDLMMATIAIRTEKEKLGRNPEESSRSIPNAISKAVGNIAEQIGASAIMTLTKTGATARNVSKFRPTIPVIAITPHVDVARQLQMVWGVKPLLMLDLDTTWETFSAALNLAQEKELVSPGDLVVLTAGTLQGVSGSTDLLKVEVVTAIRGKGIGFGEGSVSGRVRVVREDDDVSQFAQDEILVVKSTSAKYVDAIKKAKGVITEDGNVTGHAVTIGMRLDVPVIVGVTDALTLIRDGEIVTMDLERGFVYSGSHPSFHDRGNE